MFNRHNRIEQLIRREILFSILGISIKVQGVAKKLLHVICISSFREKMHKSANNDSTKSVLQCWNF
jgi:hypothetical protein